MEDDKFPYLIYLSCCIRMRLDQNLL